MRVLGVVSYKGSNYLGWEKQLTGRTIQGEIESKLSQIFNCEIKIYGSGRTDAGVHAFRQTFSFDIPKEIDLDRLCYSVNKMLDEDIHIIGFEKVSDDFHARYSAKSKTYLYKITLNTKNPFEYDLKYVYPYQFDFDLFKEACKLFEGKHCFKDFTSKEEDEDGFVREIMSSTAMKQGNEIIVQFVGDGFMRYQIRNMVGVAIEVAAGNIDISFIKNHLKEDKEREIVQYKAPAQGLYLVQVDY